MNVGEEICGEWLRHVKGCQFVQYNVQTTESQGEIDVIGIDIEKNIVYTCEVAVHLVTGLQYVRNKRPDNVDRFVSKFSRSIGYIQSNFPDYQHEFMLWSPIVKHRKLGANDQLRHVEQISEKLRSQFGVDIQPVINEVFNDAMIQLRSAAARESKELSSPIMRYLQIEEYLARHLDRIAKA
jgi:hypothetical protein